MQEELCPVAAFFGKAEKLVLRSEGRERTVEKGEEFEKILSAWGETLKEGRQMPAFGVSIDRLTREEMKTGLWIEFLFANEERCMGMPFESLLVGIRGEYRGFNVIRRTEGLYQGRCFYIDLGGGDLASFESFLLGIIG